MDIGQLLRRSWQLTRDHRWLWWLGLLAAFSEGSAGSFGRIPSGGGSSSSSSSPQQALTTVAQHWTSTDTQILIAVVLLGVVLGLIFLYVSYAANAGLVLAVDTLESEHKELGFKTAYHRGRAFVWRLFGLNLLIGLVGLVAVAAPIGLLVGLYFYTPHSAALTATLVGLGLLVVLAWFAFGFYLTVVQKFAHRSIVLENRRIVAAISAARQLTAAQLGNAALALLVMVGVGLVVGIGVFAALFAAGGILFVIGFLIYSVAHVTGAVIYGGFAILALSIALILWSGIYTSFLSSYWTLTYRALTFLAASNHHPGAVTRS